MKPSAITIAIARVLIAKEMLMNQDPRLRIAFDELRQCLVDDEQREHDSTREIIAASKYQNIRQAS